MKCFKSCCVWYSDIWLAYVASIWSKAAEFVTHTGYQRSLYIRNWHGIASENTGRRDQLVRPDGPQVYEKRHTVVKKTLRLPPYPTQWDSSATTEYGRSRVDTLNFETFQIEGQPGKGWMVNQMLLCPLMCMVMSKDFEVMLCEYSAGVTNLAHDAPSHLGSLPLGRTRTRGSGGDKHPFIGLKLRDRSHGYDDPSCHRWGVHFAKCCHGHDRKREGR